jgi:hypothetical protein
MLGVRVIYILWPPLIPLINNTLELYVLSTILNETNIALPNTLLVKFYTKNIFKANHISSVHLLALAGKLPHPSIPRS